MKIIFFLIILCSFTVYHPTLAQTPIPKRPKLGLCLSGGAAKGLAHIPLLRAIDSLGIRVDYITGTSMGAVLGGLYSIGYSGKEIDSIARRTDWGSFFSNQTPLSAININEKDQYGRYLLDLAIKNKKISLPVGLVEGQALLELLQSLTFRALTAKDFNQFPIPFRCIATDAVTGKAVVLDKGNLALALRATMSLPTIFVPVGIGDSVLVDGGLVKNFPVDELKAMGAEKTIGSYLAGKLYNRKELDSFLKLLEQISEYVDYGDIERQAKLCDLLFDFDTILLTIKATGTDFDKMDQILDLGAIKVKEMLPQLQAIADEQKKYFKDEPIPDRRRGMNLTDSLAVLGVEVISDDSENAMKAFVNRQFNTRKDSFVKLHDLSQTIELLNGTLNFKKIWYDVEQRGGENVLVVHTTEAPKTATRIGAHYDSDESGGVIVNLTLRNLLGQNSRVLLSADIADNFKVSFDYRKFTSYNKFWLNGRFYFEQVYTPFYFRGRFLEDYNRKLSFSGLGINYSINAKSFFGANLFYQDIAFAPKIAPLDRAFLSNDTSAQLTRYNFNYWGLEWRYLFNSFNKLNFPSKGFSISVTLRNQFNAEAKSTITSVAGLRVVGVDKTTQNAYTYSKLIASFDWVQTINKRFAITLQSHIGLRLIDSATNAKYLDADPFFVGGVESRNNISFFPF